MPNYFQNLDAFITTVDENIARLNIPITNACGKSVIQLVGIDGKPTNDNTILGNRQNIFNHFKKLFETYTASTSMPTIEDFQNRNEMALIVHSARYRKCVESFYDCLEDAKKKFEGINDLKKKLTDNETSVESSGCSIQDMADEIVSKLYEKFFELKYYYKEAQSQATMARLTCMMLGFIEEGDDFFNNPVNFEDTFTPCLNDMYKVYSDYHFKIKKNIHREVKDMVT